VGTCGQENIHWIDTNNHPEAKNINSIDGRQKKKFLCRWIDTVGKKSNFFTDDQYYRTNF
jgi:hypothetical protein